MIAVRIKEDVRSQFRLGHQRGLDDSTIGNLVAYEMHLHPCAGSWLA